MNTRSNSHSVSASAFSLACLLVFVAACTRQSAPDVSELTAELSAEGSDDRYSAVKDIDDRAETMTDSEAVLAVPHLQEALRDTDARVRYRAAKALSKLESAAAPAVPELANTLKDEDPQTRYYAAKALYKIGRPARPAQDALQRALGDENPDVQYYSAKALGAIGEEAKSSIGALNALAQRTTEAKIQEAASEAVKNIQGVE